MSPEGNGENPIEQRASDSEMADLLIAHIVKPCEVEVAPGDVRNIRYIYIEEAEKQLMNFTDPEAKQRLADVIKLFKGLK